MWCDRGGFGVGACEACQCAASISRFTSERKLTNTKPSRDSVPWYMTGCTRVDTTKYRGNEKAAKKMLNILFFLLLFLFQYTFCLKIIWENISVVVTMTLKNSKGKVNKVTPTNHLMISHLRRKNEGNV